MNDIYPLDIWQVIFQHCDLLSKLKLFLVCSDFYRSFYITDLYTIPKIYLYKISNSVLKQQKFSRIIELNISEAKKICDISFLTNLKKLNISGECGIDQHGIQGLDLVELNAGFYRTIKDVSFMINLKKL